MNVIFDESLDIRESRSLRLDQQKNLYVYDDNTSLLVLKSTYLQEDRRFNYASYGVIMIYLELKRRLNVHAFTYTFSKEGLIFFLEVEGTGTHIKNIMVNYEDNHPLGFSVGSCVYYKGLEVTRAEIQVERRNEEGLDLETAVDEGVILDHDYLTSFRKRMEKTMIADDYDEVLINIILFGMITADTKIFSFGCHGPNVSGIYKQINYQQFLKVIEVLRSDLATLLTINTYDLNAVLEIQFMIEEKMRKAIHQQRIGFYFVFLIMMTLTGFVNSRSFQDMSFQIKSLYVNLYETKRFMENIEGEDSLRYYSAKNGFKEGFGLYLNYYQKHREVIPTLLYIISKNEDQSIIESVGYQTLQKTQFLAKNLVNKPDRWAEFDKWCLVNRVSPYDSTQILAIVVSLDMFQRNYAKIKQKAIVRD